MALSVKKYIANSIFVIINISMTVCACIFLNDVEKIVKVVSVLAFLMLCVSIPSISNHSIHRLLMTISVFLSLLLICFIIMDLSGLLYYLNDFESIKNFILSTKQWGILVFLALTILQVVLLPIPAAVTILIGVAIYGPLWSFVLSTIGTYIGSIICFVLGRTFGKKLVFWLFGKDSTDKYLSFFDSKGRGMFIIMLLFPFFPDDLICMAAGISNMSKKFFITAILLTRPVMIGFTAFLGSGKIIPFRGWGIPVWIVLFAITVICFLLITLFRKKMSEKKKKAII